MTREQYWRAQMRRIAVLLVIWAFIAIILGIAATQISWGDPNGFHGTGIPFAAVYWDYIDDADRPIDFPNPYAPVLNCATFLIVGSIVIFTAYWLVGLFRRTSSLRREKAT